MKELKEEIKLLNILSSLRFCLSRSEQRRVGVRRKESQQSCPRRRGCGGVVAKKRVEREGHSPDWGTGRGKEWRGQPEQTHAHRWVSTDCIFILFSGDNICSLFLWYTLCKVCAQILNWGRVAKIGILPAYQYMQSSPSDCNGWMNVIEWWNFFKTKSICLELLQLDIYIFFYIYWYYWHLNFYPNSLKQTPFAGRVVGILQRNWRDYVVTFPTRDTTQSQSRNSQRILVTPWDTRIPKIRISTQQADTLQVDPPSEWFAHLLTSTDT